MHRYTRFLTTFLCAAGTFSAVGFACERCEKWGPFYKETKAAMTQMDIAMKQADDALQGDPDKDFIALMIPHHQAAVDMAKAIVLHGNDPALKNIAQEIVAEQAIEIQYLQKIRERLAASQPAPTVGRDASSDGNDYRFAANESASAPKTDNRAHDRVYTADQISNTVSVIDPTENKLLGLIKLGEPPPAALAPLYKGQSLVHGLGFSPDGSRLCVVSIGSNSITLIDTATNKVLKTQYLGRAPHEAFFTPDGKEIYAAVRGEDYVSVLDAATLAEKARIRTNPGPGMVLFRPDGKYAFVPSSFTPELCVIDTASHDVVARVPQASPFSPNLAVSADGKQVWFTLKDSGKTQIMDAAPPFAILGTLPTGPISNHVALVDNAQGHFAYVTVGGIDEVKVYRREPPFEPVATIATGALPHGIWNSPDGSRVYIGLENEARVQAIDTLANKIIANIPIGQLPQALVYVSNAAPDGRADAGLLPLTALKESKVYQLRPEDSKQSGRASVTVASLGLLDQIQVAASGLMPGQEYTLGIATGPQGAGALEALTKMKATPDGNLIANSLGPVSFIAPPGDAAAHALPARTFALIPGDGSAGPRLVQQP